MGIKEKLVQSLNYNKIGKGEKSENNVQAKKNSQVNNLSNMLSGSQAVTNANPMTKTQNAKGVGATQGKSNSIWTNLKNSFNTNNANNAGAQGSMYDINPLELQKAQSMTIDPKKMYQSDVLNNYNRLEKNNSIFGKMSVDGNKDVLENVNNSSEYGFLLHCSIHIWILPLPRTLTCSWNRRDLHPQTGREKSSCPISKMRQCCPN